jgi:hypothetical protein
MKVRKRHTSFPIATGEQYAFSQPTTAAHIGKHKRRYNSEERAYFGADMTREFATVMAEHMNNRKGIELPSSRYQFIK